MSNIQDQYDHAERVHDRIESKPAGFQRMLVLGEHDPIHRHEMYPDARARDSGIDRRLLAKPERCLSKWTTWEFDPAPGAAPLELHVSMPCVVGEVPIIRRIVIGRERRRIRIPEVHDRAMQMLSCQETECSPRPFACENRAHRHIIVGGLAPHARRIDDGEGQAPEVAPTLAVETRPATISVATADEILEQRARARAAAKGAP